MDKGGVYSVRREHTSCGTYRTSVGRVSTEVDCNIEKNNHNCSLGENRAIINGRASANTALRGLRVDSRNRDWSQNMVSSTKLSNERISCELSSNSPTTPVSRLFQGSSSHREQQLARTTPNATSSTPHPSSSTTYSEFLDQPRIRLQFGRPHTPPNRGRSRPPVGRQKSRDQLVPVFPVELLRETRRNRQRLRASRLRALGASDDVVAGVNVERGDCFGEDEIEGPISKMHEEEVG